MSDSIECVGSVYGLSCSLCIYTILTYVLCVCVCVCVQTIEKQTVDRMKRRHKNIHNEILMEKRVRA